MSRKMKSETAGKPRTLSDADISSQRAVTRRSLLGALGLSAGVAATTVLGASESALAADADKTKDSKSKGKKTPPKEEADSD